VEFIAKLLCILTSLQTVMLWVVTFLFLRGHLSVVWICWGYKFFFLKKCIYFRLHIMIFIYIYVRLTLNFLFIWFIKPFSYFLFLKSWITNISWLSDNLFFVCVTKSWEIPNSYLTLTLAMNELAMKKISYGWISNQWINNE
jgi:hypothetical protein